MILTTFNLVPTNQFGARPHPSTVHLTLSHDIAAAHAKGGCCGSLQVDIQGFFDRINYETLIHTFRIIENICRWHTSFLAGRVVQPRFNRFTSDLIDITVGEPQGSQPPSFSQVSTHSHCYSKPTDGLTAYSAVCGRWQHSRMGPFYQLVRT